MSIRSRANPPSPGPWAEAAVTGVDPITIRQSFEYRARYGRSLAKMKLREKNEECIDSVTGQETQLAILGTTERALYTVQSIRKVLHYDVLQKEPESHGSVWKLREADGTHRPELDRTRQKGVEYAGNYSIVQGLGSVNPYSYPCRHVRASDLWCRG